MPTTRDVTVNINVNAARGRTELQGLGRDITKFAATVKTVAASVGKVRLGVPSLAGWDRLESDIKKRVTRISGLLKTIGTTKVNTPAIRMESAERVVTASVRRMRAELRSLGTARIPAPQIAGGTAFTAGNRSAGGSVRTGVGGGATRVSRAEEIADATKLKREYDALYISADRYRQELTRISSSAVAGSNRQLDAMTKIRRLSDQEAAAAAKIAAANKKEANEAVADQNKIAAATKRASEQEIADANKAASQITRDQNQAFLVRTRNIRAQRAALTEQTRRNSFNSDIAQGVTGVGNALTAGVTAPIVGASVVAIKTAMDYEAALRNVNTELQLGEKEFQQYYQSVIQISRDPNITAGPKELAVALFNVVGAGYNAKQSLEIVRVAALGATAGLTTTKASSEALVAVLRSGISGVNSAQQAMDILLKGAHEGKLTFDELAGQLGKVLPAATAAGISLDEVVAGIASITVQGQPASRATTQLLALINKIIDPGKAASKVWKELGINFGSAATHAKDLNGILKEIYTKTHGGNLDQLTKLFPDSRSRGAVLALLKNDTAIYTDNIKGMKDATAGLGETQRAANEQNKSFANQLKMLGKQFEIIADEDGPALIHALQAGLTAAKPFLDAISNIADAFAKLDPDQQRVILGWVAFGAAVGPVISGLGNVAQGFLTLEKYVIMYKDAQLAGNAAALASERAAATAAGAAATEGSAIATLGGEAVAATSQVTALSLALTGLAALGVITVGVIATVAAYNYIGKPLAELVGKNADADIDKTVGLSVKQEAKDQGVLPFLQRKRDAIQHPERYPKGVEPENQYQVQAYQKIDEDANKGLAKGGASSAAEANQKYWIPLLNRAIKTLAQQITAAPNPTAIAMTHWNDQKAKSEAADAAAAALKKKNGGSGGGATDKDDGKTKDTTGVSAAKLAEKKASDAFDAVLKAFEERGPKLTDAAAAKTFNLLQTQAGAVRDRQTDLAIAERDQKIADAKDDTGKNNARAEYKDEELIKIGDDYQKRINDIKKSRAKVQQDAHDAETEAARKLRAIEDESIKTSVEKLNADKDVLKDTLDNTYDADTKKRLELEIYNIDQQLATKQSQLERNQALNIENRGLRNATLAGVAPRLAATQNSLSRDYTNTTRNTDEEAAARQAKQYRSQADGEDDPLQKLLLLAQADRADINATHDPNEQASLRATAAKNQADRAGEFFGGVAQNNLFNLVGMNQSAGAADARSNYSNVPYQYSQLGENFGRQRSPTEGATAQNIGGIVNNQADLLIGGVKAASETNADPYLTIDKTIALFNQMNDDLIAMHASAKDVVDFRKKAGDFFLEGTGKGTGIDEQLTAADDVAKKGGTGNLAQRDSMYAAVIAGINSPTGPLADLDADLRQIIERGIGKRLATDHTSESDMAAAKKEQQKVASGQLNRNISDQAGAGIGNAVGNVDWFSALSGKANAGREAANKFWAEIVSVGKQSISNLVKGDLFDPLAKRLTSGLKNALKDGGSGLNKVLNDTLKNLGITFQGGIMGLATVANSIIGAISILGGSGKSGKKGGIAGMLVGGIAALATGGAALPLISAGASLGSGLATGNIGSIVTGGLGFAGGLGVNLGGGAGSISKPGSPANLLASYGAGHAFGGSVYAGMAYPVGERGRELFLPRQDGTIMPSPQAIAQQIPSAARTNASMMSQIADYLKEGDGGAFGSNGKVTYNDYGNKYYPTDAQRQTRQFIRTVQRQMRKH